MNVTIWSDIGCPWASLTVWRLHARRAALGLDEVRFEHRCFPIELFNDVPTHRAVIGAEVAAIAPLIPDAGWRPWWREDWLYPVTTVPALEAVQAAKEQGLDASERLDLALRQAFWRDARCISLRSEILAAAETAGIDVAALAAALDDGRARAAVIADWRAAADGAAEGSPHVWVGNDGVLNPGIDHHWEGPKPGGSPVIDNDDMGAIDRLLKAAAAG
ncbi:MAG TPA: DsbA family protein [Frankiaceae bacterium]|nr:DsbA family protein [Frankiaceae bacterium]